MKRKSLYLVLLVLLFILVSCLKNNDKKNIIERCVDGDTVVINGEKIRILEIDTFESKRNEHARRQAKKFKMSLKSVVEKGQQAKELCDRDWKGKNVKLIKWKTDKYGRTLAYIEGYSEYMIRHNVGYYVKPF